MSTHATTRVVGAPVPRKEGVEKLLGSACYIDDMEREGMWRGVTVRSAIPRGSSQAPTPSSERAQQLERAAHAFRHRKSRAGSRAGDRTHSLSMPNLHHLLVNLEPFGQDNPNHIFVPIDEPHRTIEATIER